MFMAIAGIGMSLYGAYASSQAKKKGAKKLKEIGAIRSAELMRQAGQEDDLRVEQKQVELDDSARRQGRVEALYSKSGLMLTGTPGQAIREQKEVDLYNIDQQDDASAERARRLRLQASLETMQASSAASGYNYGAQADLINGVGSAMKSGGALAGKTNNWFGGQQQQPDTRHQKYSWLDNLEGWQS